MTIAQQRAAAEERAHALLRSIVPEEELRWEVQRVPQIPGRAVPYGCLERVLTHLEFMGQSGQYQYQIWFQGTSENIARIDSVKGYRGGLCGGPNPWNDYIISGLRVDRDLMLAARAEANDQNTQPLSLPRSDIWLGQYLALKYDEQNFLCYANAF